MGGIRLLIPCEDAQTVVGSSKGNTRIVTHRYQFLVDGKPVLDPRGTGMARDERYERVSLVAVS